MVNNTKIAVVLPYGEHFSPTHTGAIGLCRKEYVEHSRFGSQIKVFGGQSLDGHPEVDYTKINIKFGWFSRKTKAYSHAILNTAKDAGVKIIEINNRPIMVHQLAKKTDKKIVLYLHNDPTEMKGAKTAKQRKWLIRHCAAIFCVSEFIKARFLSDTNAHPTHVHVAYPGIKLPTVKLEQKQKLFLYSGRMIEEKGALAFAQALSIVLPQLPDWRGVMIGATTRDSQTAYEQETRAVINALGERAEYRPFSSHQSVMALFQRAHIAVVPSVWDEPFGRTAAEALANGCALICSDRGGLKEITNGAAMRCHEVSAEALAAQMLLLASHQTLRSDFQNKAIARSQVFSIQQSVKHIDQYYQELLAS